MAKEPVGLPTGDEVVEAANETISSFNLSQSYESLPGLAKVAIGVAVTALVGAALIGFWLLVKTLFRGIRLRREVERDEGEEGHNPVS